MTRLSQLKQLVETLASPESLAEQFCELDDDAQAQFFVHVARIAATWPPTQFAADAAGWQAGEIGKHLKTCSCSTEEARDFVRNIAAAMEDRS